MVIDKALLQKLTSPVKGVASSSGSALGGDDKKVSGVILKPQRLFKDKVDNSYNPFVPKLRKKHNAMSELPGF